MTDNEARLANHGCFLPAEDERLMSVGCEEHLCDIVQSFRREAQNKYRAGQMEHGGQLWRKPVVEALGEEMLDGYVYFHTLRAQIKEAIWWLDKGVPLAARNVLVYGNAEGEEQDAPAETRRDSGVVLQPVVRNSESMKGA